MDLRSSAIRLPGGALVQLLALARILELRVARGPDVELVVQFL